MKCIMLSSHLKQDTKNGFNHFDYSRSSLNVSIIIYAVVEELFPVWLLVSVTVRLSPGFSRCCHGISS